MATKIISMTYQLKRGAQESIEAANPILAAGEPIVVWCIDGKTRLKIGDGKTPYIDLDWIGNETSNTLEVLTFDYRLDFPVPGDENYIYRAKDVSILYQWNNSKYVYESLTSTDVNLDIKDIEFIDGGNAEDLLKD